MGRERPFTVRRVDVAALQVGENGALNRDAHEAGEGHIEQGGEFSRRSLIALVRTLPGEQHLPALLRRILQEGCAGSPGGMLLALPGLPVLRPSPPHTPIEQERGQREAGVRLSQAIAADLGKTHSLVQKAARPLIVVFELF